MQRDLVPGHGASVATDTARLCPLGPGRVLPSLSFCG